MKRICLKCEKKTPDTPCPYCGGGKFQNVWDGEKMNKIKEKTIREINSERINLIREIIKVNEAHIKILEKQVENLKEEKRLNAEIVIKLAEGC